MNGSGGTMNGRKRFEAVFRGQLPDRVPVTLFIQDQGHFISQLYPDIDPWDSLAPAAQDHRGATASWVSTSWRGSSSARLPSSSGCSWVALT